MNRRRHSSDLRARALGVLLLLVAAFGAGSWGCGTRHHETASPVPVPSADPRLEEATRLYDGGRYAEAKVLLETLDGEGRANGPALYRLAFCLGALKDREGERRVLERAVAALETEVGSSGGLESSFYLANAYRNLGRAAEARDAAAAATGRVERGEAPSPSLAVDQFRLAKLYADQGLTGPAQRWYQAALEGFAAEPDRYPAYIQWASRYLGDLAFSKADFATAEKFYGTVAQSPGASVVDLRRLGISRVRLGRFAEAADAWGRAEKLDPAEADDVRYGARVASQAAVIGHLPPSGPDGRAWNAYTREEIEKTMADQVAVARETLGQAEQSPLPAGVTTDALQARLDQAHATFLAAALEYTARGLPIRETAFVGGYAPLIFHPEQWSLPQPPPSDR
jgi:tetratricopeptide (TPR) repeat protein